MEVPTTDDVTLLMEMQELMNEHIRPAAEEEINEMHPRFASTFKEERLKLIPSSIVIDIMLYMTQHLSLMATDEVMIAKDSGDVELLMDRCAEFDPYWKAARALSLCVKVFAQPRANGSEYIEQ
mgnify:CR=1 FL=1